MIPKNKTRAEVLRLLEEMRTQFCDESESQSSAEEHLSFPCVWNLKAFTSCAAGGSVQISKPQHLQDHDYCEEESTPPWARSDGTCWMTDTGDCLLRSTNLGENPSSFSQEVRVSIVESKNETVGTFVHLGLFLLCYSAVTS